MTSDEITQMQEILAHQDKQIQELNEMVARQWDEIDILKKRHIRLQDKIAELEEARSDNPESGLSATEIAALNKPPHY